MNRKGSNQVTKKDYILIAAALKDSKPHFDWDEAHTEELTEVWRAVVYSIGGALASDNHKFDRRRFIIAAGVTES